MKQAFWLLAFITCWSLTGFALFDTERTTSGPNPLQTQKVERIVSLAPNLTEIIYAIGLEDQLAGVTIDSDYPPQAATKPKVGTFWQPNIEAIIALHPQLVVTLGFGTQSDLASRLNRIGYNCLTLRIETTSDFFNAVNAIGSATGNTIRAQALVNNMQSKLEQLSNRFGQGKKTKVLWVVQREPLMVAGRRTFINEIIEFAGGENAIGPTLHQYPPIGAERVIASGAEVIIEPSMVQTDLAIQRTTAIEYWSRFRNLPAVANKRIYVIDGDTVSRLSPRLCQGVETVARCIKPEFFEK